MNTFHLGRNQWLRNLLCFSSRREDLIRAYPWSKKYLINDWEIIIAYWEESEQSEMLANKCALFQKTTGTSGGFLGEGVIAVKPPENFAILILI